MYSMNKKKQELQVFEDVIDFCLSAGGAKRRNARKISSYQAECSERPDLILSDKGKRILGLEHFRIDHHIGNGKKLESLSAKQARQIESTQNKIKGCENDEQKLTYASTFLAQTLAQEIYNRHRSCCNDLARSLERSLFDSKAGHANKLKDYNKHLEKSYRKAEERGLGYLIEVHSDFQGLYLTQNRQTKQLTAGECPPV